MKVLKQAWKLLNILEIKTYNSEIAEHLLWLSKLNMFIRMMRSLMYIFYSFAIITDFFILKERIRKRKKLNTKKISKIIGMLYEKTNL